MRIERTETPGAVRLALEGRLDSSWSESVAAALEEAIRLGRPRIELDMRATSFVSSVGLGTIVTAFTRFRAVGGVLAIVDATEPVRKMLRVSRLEGLLGLAAAPDAVAAPTGIAIGSGWQGDLERTQAPATPVPLTWVPAGTLRADARTVAVGHVALAGDAAAGAGLYGDGLAAGGTVASFPADAPRPDCLASTEAGSVTVLLRHGLVAEASPAWHGHFEQSPGGKPVTLGGLVRAVVKAVDGPAAVVVCGECAGAFGAWARSSPDHWPAEPEGMDAESLRRAIRFAGEPMHVGETLVAVAFAAPANAIDAFPAAVRRALPDQGDGFHMHAHVAVVAYRPMPRQAREVTAVGSLLAEQPLRGVLHALAAPGGAESAFVRGSLWAFRIGGGG